MGGFAQAEAAASLRLVQLSDLRSEERKKGHSPSHQINVRGSGMVDIGWRADRKQIALPNLVGDLLERRRAVAQRQLVALMRLKYMCRSYSQVKPIPPCTCIAWLPRNAPGPDADALAIAMATLRSGPLLSIAQVA
jgi:hypothetical protein